MSSLGNITDRIPPNYDKSNISDVIRAITTPLGLLLDGKIAPRASQSSVPSGGSMSYALGDFVLDSNPTVTNGSVRIGWVCTVSGTPGTFQEARVLVANFGQVTSSLGADVALNNTANYFDGPSVAQGTVGTWCVSGSVTLADSAGAANYNVKLWDGTTVIASARMQQTVGNVPITIHLSGVITSPAGNLRISVKDETSTSGSIRFNVSGNSKDSTITAIRIG